MESFVIGVDLGATQVRAGAFTPGGDLLVVDQTGIEARRGPKAGLARIIELIERLLHQPSLHRTSLLGIGVGATGPVDPSMGVILNPGTLPGWENTPIRAQLEAHFDIPGCLENDADAAALGEYWQGAGRGVSRLYAVTLGTGIGVACVVDGQLYRGASGFHPEGGHQVLDPSGPPCYCGARGCWESLASGSAIAQEARMRLSAWPVDNQSPSAKGDSQLFALCQGDLELIDARLVIQAARQGDPLARQVVERAAEYFALGIFNLVMLFFPELIVLSGGVMRSSDLFMPTIQRILKSADPYLPTSQLRILPAQLGYYAGIYGAAYAILGRIVIPG